MPTANATTTRKSTTSRKRTPLTPEQRAQRRAQDREQITNAVRELRTSAGWLAWLNARARFRNYSPLNCMLIAQQRPEATAVASMTAWNRLGRSVKRGERAIAITVFSGSFDAQRTDGTEEEIPIFRMRRCLFDVEQTEGDPLPELPSEPITGDSHADYLPLLAAYAHQLGYATSFETINSEAHGYCDYTSRRIVVDAALPPNAQVRVLVHEIAHALGIASSKYGRAQAETLVESVTHIVCRALGLDTTAASVPYVADWDTNDLEPLRAFANVVDDTARKIEDAILTPTEPE